jgi:hypothetical protein
MVPEVCFVLTRSLPPPPDLSLFLPGSRQSRNLESHLGTPIHLFSPLALHVAPPLNLCIHHHTGISEPPKQSWDLYDSSPSPYSRCRQPPKQDKRWQGGRGGLLLMLLSSVVARCYVEPCGPKSPRRVHDGRAHLSRDRPRSEFSHFSVDERRRTRMRVDQDGSQ